MATIARKAEGHEIDWINDQYKSIGFIPSDLTRETVVIAEVDGKKAGLGRLVHIGGNDWELGGMYVREEFRGKGAADAIVRFLLSLAEPDQRIFCLPFAHLYKFYGSFGFMPCKEANVPEEITKKHRWCNETYKDEALLYILDRNKNP